MGIFPTKKEYLPTKKILFFIFFKMLAKFRAASTLTTSTFKITATK